MIEKEKEKEEKDSQEYQKVNLSRNGEKTGLRDFQPGLTQTGLYSHRRLLEA